MVLGGTFKNKQLSFDHDSERIVMDNVTLASCKGLIEGSRSKSSLWFIESGIC